MLFGKDPDNLGIVFVRYSFDNDSSDSIQWRFGKKCKNESFIEKKWIEWKEFVIFVLVFNSLSYLKSFLIQLYLNVRILPLGSIKISNVNVTPGDVCLKLG